MNNYQKVRVNARLISFLMPHQDVLPDLKEIAEQLNPNKEGLDRNSEEYMLGAYEAMTAFLEALKEKGPATQE